MIKKLLTKVFLHLYCFFFCQRIGDTFFFPIIIGTKYLTIALTKINSRYVYFERQKEIDDKIPIFIGYKLGFDFEREIRLIDKENLDTI